MQLRDQSEDRPQSNNIIVGKQTPNGVKFGVLGRDGQYAVEPVYPAQSAVAIAALADEYDRKGGLGASFLSTF